MGSVNAGRLSPAGGLSSGLPPVVKHAEHRNAISAAGRLRARPFTRRDITAGNRPSQEKRVGHAIVLAYRTSIRYAQDVSTKDQLLYVALHGTAMRYAAEQRKLAESIAELREMAGGRNDILAEAAGIEAGSWYATPAAHVGHELLAAGMLILAGGGNGTPLDYTELERWTRVGFDR